MKVNFTISTVCYHSAKVQRNIPEELLPLFQKFLAEHQPLYIEDLDAFLRKHVLFKDDESVGLYQNINDYIHDEYTIEDTEWDACDGNEIDVENEDYSTFDFQKDVLLKALSQVRQCGHENMLNRTGVTNQLYELDFIAEARRLETLSRKEYIQLITKDLPEWERLGNEEEVIQLP